MLPLVQKAESFNLNKELPEIAIIAPGLLGASIGAASRKLNLSVRINVWARREETRAACDKLPWCDQVHSNIGDAVRNADMIWVCAPVASIPRLIQQFAQDLKPGAIVTDVGSTKAKLVKQCELAIGDHGIFVGSHPMAGSEKSGLEHAEVDLYCGKPCFVTPGKASTVDAVSVVEEYWKSLGMRTICLPANEHDRIVAYISHLPHLVASTLAALLFDRADESWKDYVGTGILDTTRVASGSVQMWKDIVDDNRDEILPVLTDMIASLEHLKAHVEGGHPDALEEVLNKGKLYRDGICPHR